MLKKKFLIAIVFVFWFSLVLATNEWDFFDEAVNNMLISFVEKMSDSTKKYLPEVYQKCEISISNPSIFDCGEFYEDDSLMSTFENISKANLFWLNFREGLWIDYDEDFLLSFWNDNYYDMQKDLNHYLKKSIDLKKKVDNIFSVLNQKNIKLSGLLSALQWVIQINIDSMELTKATLLILEKWEIYFE